MFSVVCVYNNEKSFNNYLLKSLEQQTAKFELIKIDNRRGAFKSASKGLNYGGEKAKGKYILFVHQDVVFYSKFWLEDVEKMLENMPSLGIAGCSGKMDNGEKRGFIKDRHQLWGEPFSKPEEVQTLDESVLIIPKVTFDRLKFDEKLEGWHAYGVDYCLMVKEKGLKAYAIPAFIYHYSPSLNYDRLLQAHKKVWIKHRENFPSIFTTCGKLHWVRLMTPSFMKDILRPFYRKVFPIVPEYNTFLERELYHYKRVLFLHGRKDFLNQSRLLPHLVKSESFSAEGASGQKEIIHYYLSKEETKRIRFREKSFDGLISTLEVLNNSRDSLLFLKKIEGWVKKEVIIIESNNGVFLASKRVYADLEKQGCESFRLNERGMLKKKKTKGIRPVYIKMMGK
ncbi:MAG: glycosyltransferase [Candidatus Bathyarchaeota archaeon]|nr:glycosyltransferase [Candidatus Bathyarchaeota archaeon]